MNKYIISDTGWKNRPNRIYTRISKAAAKKAYYNNDNLAFCPVKLRPGFAWYPEITCNLELCGGRSFEQALSSFEFYNCNNETGNYTAFYIVEEISA